MHRLALLLYIAFVLIALVWPSWRLWRRERLCAVVFPQDASIQAWVGRCFRGTLLAMGVLLSLLALWPTAGLGPLAWHSNLPVRWGGLLAVGLCLPWVTVAQWQMGRAWRIGIDTHHPAPLIVHGIFRWSRNPVFLGMRIALWGLLMALPDAAVLALVTAADGLMQLQVRHEEEHLRAQHGPAYVRYAQGASRWLGWPRRRANSTPPRTVESSH